MVSLQLVQLSEGLTLTKKEDKMQDDATVVGQVHQNITQQLATFARRGYDLRGGKENELC